MTVRKLNFSWIEYEREKFKCLGEVVTMGWPSYGLATLFTSIEGPGNFKPYFGLRYL